MKKIIMVVGVLVGILAIGLFVASFYLGPMVKAGIETLGPKIIKVSVHLDSVSLSPFSGQGTLRGLTLGNPEGFKSPNALKVEGFSISVQPATIFFNKVVVNAILIEGIEINAENMGNNLSKLMENIGSSSGASSSKRRYQVDELMIRGGKINIFTGAMSERGVSIPLPDIELKDLGKDGSGLSADELAQKLMAAVLEKAIPAIAENAVKIGADTLKDAGNLLEGAGGLFK
jgi:hypothetical protein